MSIGVCVYKVTRQDEVLHDMNFLARSIKEHKHIQLNHFNSQYSLLKIAELRCSEEKRRVCKNNPGLENMGVGEEKGKTPHKINHQNCKQVKQGWVVHLHFVLEQQRPPHYALSWQLQKLIFKPLEYQSPVGWHFPLVCLVFESVAQTPAFAGFWQDLCMEDWRGRDSKCQQWAFQLSS